MSGILHIPLSVLDAAESDADTRRLVWLFRRASWKRQVFPWRQKSGAVRNIPLDKGEVFATLRYLSEVWKEGVGAIRGFLARMEARGVVEVVQRAGVTVVRLLTLADAKGKARDASTDAGGSTAQATGCDESETSRTGTQAEAGEEHEINRVNKSNPPTPKPRQSRSSRALQGARRRAPEPSPFARFMLALGKGQVAPSRPAPRSAPVDRPGHAENGKGPKPPYGAPRPSVALSGHPAPCPVPKAGTAVQNAPAPSRALSPAQVEEARAGCDPVRWERLKMAAALDRTPAERIEEAAARRWRADAIMRGVQLAA